MILWDKEHIKKIQSDALAAKEALLSDPGFFSTLKYIGRGNEGECRLFNNDTVLKLHNNISEGEALLLIKKSRQALDANITLAPLLSAIVAPHKTQRNHRVFTTQPLVQGTPMIPYSWNKNISTKELAHRIKSLTDIGGQGIANFCNNIIKTSKLGLDIENTYKNLIIADKAKEICLLDLRIKKPKAIKINHIADFAIDMVIMRANQNVENKIEQMPQECEKHGLVDLYNNLVTNAKEGFAAAGISQSRLSYVKKI